VCAGIVLDFTTRFGRDAAVSMLLLMATLKALELRTARDAMVIINLGYFLIITGFLYSQAIPLAVYMLVLMVIITAVLISLQRRVASFTPRQSVRIAGNLILQGVPLMLVLFVLFPRVQGPLFGLPQSSPTGVSGLSDEMSPGSLSSLSLSDDVAFRVQFESTPPKPSTLYWRGPVLWDFDGRTWRMAKMPILENPVHESRSNRIRYSVTLEPQQSKWLFAIDLPTKLPSESLLTADYQLLTRQTSRYRQRYEMESDLDYVLSPEESPSMLRRALRLPADGNSRARQLATRFRQEARAPREIIDQALNFFRTQRFFYTLAPPELGAETVDEFLFDTKRGFCEHYASSFVFLMRAANIPARVVTGYLGGEVNPIGNYLIVRQAEAHAWAEVWLSGKGWLRIDPTAAVSPARIEIGLAAALPAGEPLPLGLRIDASWIRQLRYVADATANGWNQWILGYTKERQARLLTGFGMGPVHWQELTLLLLFLGGAATGVLALSLLKDIHLLRPPAEIRIYRRFLRKLSRVGLQPIPGEGPLAFSERVIRANHAWADSVRTITSTYLEIRYGQQHERKREFARAVQHFSPFRTAG
jgi:transglutaminase-like putative cysteine protease